MDFFIKKSTRCTNFTNLFWHETLHVLDKLSKTCRVSIIRSLFTVRSTMVYVIQVFRQLSSRTRMELQFHPGPVSCQNKFVKLVHLVGFIIKKFVTMHGHMNVKYINGSLCRMSIFIFFKISRPTMRPPASQTMGTGVSLRAKR